MDRGDWTMRLQEKEQLEIGYWCNSTASTKELNSRNSLTNVINKMTDAGVFLNCVSRFADIFTNAGSILELGAGQGWASCLVKRLYPQASVIVTDISPAALDSLHIWEHTFQVRIDRVACAKSYAIDANAESIDCIFCFAAAHHFSAYRRTLQDVHRVLKPGGHCFYFYEPSCPALWYNIALKRVNRKRPEVPEDVLVYRKIRRLAEETGLKCDIYFDASLYKRAPVETIYYAILRAMPVLQRWMPCTATYHFIKPPVA
jgi:SAM-dependent methyltransferase